MGALFIYLYIDDQKRRVLIDTGSPVSFMPQTKGTQSSQIFSTVSGQVFTTFEREPHKVADESSRSTMWKFYGAHINTPIVGTDFLKHCNAIINFEDLTVKFGDRGKRRFACSVLRNGDNRVGGGK